MQIEVTPVDTFVHDDHRMLMGRSQWVDEYLAREWERAGLVIVNWRPIVAPTPTRLISRRWAGSTVVCIASGPSLTLADCDTVRDWIAEDPVTRKAIAVCTSFRQAMWADVLYACDGRWWDVYATSRDGKPTWRDFAGECWIGDPWAATRLGLNLVTVVEEAGLSRVPGRIHSGGNSGYQAIGLAFMWGAARIVLLGYDFQRTDGKSHCHGDHEGGLPNLGPLDEWVARTPTLGRDLTQEGVAVVNATRKTAIKCFTREKLDKALRGESKAHRSMMQLGASL